MPDSGRPSLSPNANIHAAMDPEASMFVVEATVDPPLDGDPQVNFVTVQYDAQTARERFEWLMEKQGLSIESDVTVSAFVDGREVEVDGDDGDGDSDSDSDSGSDED